MKIVVNKCYGGFGLSAAAIVYYLKLKGLPCFFYTQTKYSHRDSVDLFEKASYDEIKDETFPPYTFTKDLGDSFSKWPRNDASYFYFGNLHRDDLFLVQTVEDVGEKESSSRFAELKVIEIPDGIEWEIDEYDGIESIHEVHRSW